MATATAGSSKLHITVITPAKAVLDADATSIVVPAFDGELGVMPGHADMLALLGAGVLRLTTPEGNQQRVAIRGGFLQVNHNKVTVLTPESLAQTDLKADALAAERQKLDAEKPTKLEERDAQTQKREWLVARERTLQPTSHAGH
jgi:F-type H+-transporting ATPase subunit epsilon